MKPSSCWSDILVFAGQVAMLVGAIDPLEGSLLILPGGGLMALGAYFSRHPHRRLLYKAFGLMAAGVATLWGVSAIGGFGGDTGRSLWWALVLLPYPAGWVMSLVGTIGRGRYRSLLFAAFVLMAAGIVTVMGLSLVERARSAWSALFLVPYLAGVLVGIIAAVLTWKETFRVRA